MNLACLDGFITFRVVCPGGTYVKPKSGLHVEDLPGFSTASLAAVEPGKYLNAQTFVNEKMRVSGEMLMDQIRNHLEQYSVEGGPKEAGVIGTWSEDEETLDTTVDLQGVRVRVSGGQMMVVSVPRVWIRIGNDEDVEDVTLYIRDGETVEERVVSLLGKGVENEIWLHYEAKGKQVDVYVEDERLVMYTGSTAGTKYFTTCSTCGGHARYKNIAGSGLEGKFAEVDALRGIRAEAVATCTIDGVACILLRKFRFAMLYQFGILALEEWLASPRTNYFTIHSKEWALDTLEKWSKFDLPRHMKTNIKTLAHYVSQLDPDCLDCGTGATYTNVHP